MAKEFIILPKFYQKSSLIFLQSFTHHRCMNKSQFFIYDVWANTLFNWIYIFKTSLKCNCIITKQSLSHFNLLFSWLKGTVRLLYLKTKSRKSTKRTINIFHKILSFGQNFEFLDKNALSFSGKCRLLPEKSFNDILNKVGTIWCSNISKFLSKRQQWVTNSWYIFSSTVFDFFFFLLFSKEKKFAIGLVLVWQFLSLLLRTYILNWPFYHSNFLSEDVRIVSVAGAWDCNFWPWPSCWPYSRSDHYQETSIGIALIVPLFLSFSLCMLDIRFWLHRF